MASAGRSEPEDDVREVAAFGLRLRRLRQSAGMTLKELAERAGLAVSTISKIENDRMSPTYDVLLRLAGGLSIDLTSLLEGPAPAASQPLGRLNVTRAGERRRHPTGTYVYEPFATGLRRKLMDPTFVTVTARSINEFPGLIRHPGEELVYVISGTVELHAEFYAPIRLEAGDSVYFDATMGHAYVSVGPEDATILNICCGTGGVPPVELPRAL
ncbi:XRE family transcriptional regulator [Mesorhizobium sp. L-8-10]|uniref:helix-turn-helix domain-containing protein n=1 Tax=unclassified Mesorhizobium TaxID=325217 RepID=UPI0019297873|nr:MULTISPECIES: XRE family transcriptional regulator [unclassified Mesorhizobium]BCH21222.1 XRE family transcriptional regulator [Mesorhizobium sp. L-8-3]BCH29063.1 XRE family transcriptional regulator [Mesorhizobium sp. L-8-10]